MSNKERHIIGGLSVLVVILSIIVWIQNRDFGLLNLGIGILWSEIVFMIGVCLPDIDHQAVQKKLGLEFLGEFTKHRGHVHSIVASLVYGFCVCLFAMWIRVEFWFMPTIASIAGFWTHLIQDDAKRWHQDHKPKRGFKFW